MRSTDYFILINDVNLLVHAIVSILALYHDTIFAAVRGGAARIASESVTGSSNAVPEESRFNQYVRYWMRKRGIAYSVPAYALAVCEYVVCLIVIASTSFLLRSYFTMTPNQHLKRHPFLIFILIGL